ncbi:MAG: tRNA preQ1(34) S-adenosylmethionine ribosyltransferase-isomerase QueA [Acidobacteria bacterium]|nr:tRNA preQ1(34) S-adenosylmethionine ribosyltransferase-isomerase QueA [Acidobacteriota bacterium]
MRRRDFWFDLPPELIAQEARERGRSRMLRLDPSTGAIEHSRFDALPQLLHAGDLLVLNDTEVFPARIVSRPRGNMARGIELLLTRRVAPMRWHALCRPAKRVKAGDRLVFSDALSATLEEKLEDGSVTVSFDGSIDEAAFWRELDTVGVTPLPPYIRREEPRPDDREAYQTVYAANRGAVAAPTAGLHFTREILDEVEARGVGIARLTLHVGVGTFRPVTADKLEDHRMDAEWFTVPRETAEAVAATKARGGRVVAVGTTSVRALESAAHENGTVAAGDASTALFITPGFRFKVVDALLTNFHLPESTLLMLVSAFAGRDLVLRAYEEAIREKYFFFSFGDCMFIEGRVLSPES